MRFKFLSRWRTCFWFLIFVICLLLGGCRATSNPKEADLLHIQSTNNTFNGKKKVIFVLVDSLMEQLIQRGIEHNELPVFQYLIQHGQYYPDMISSFPTMSISIDSTLLTGRYPDAHHVPGLTWYPHQGQKVIGYGSAPVEILRRGTKSVLTHALKDLNDQHLNPDVPTIYEDLKQLGFTSGSVNGLVYRGMTSHQIDLPQPLRGLVPLALPFQVKGPDFLLIYLPDLDGKLHKHGLTDREGIKETDQRLSELLEAYESQAQAPNDTILIVAGDSGMSQVLPKEQQPVIDLPKLLQRYHVLPTGQTMNSSTEIALAVNDTMAYVYSLKPENSLKEIADVLRNDPRIDLITWQEDGWIHCVKAGDPAAMRFKAGGDWIDPYNQSWSVQGTEQILDLKRESISERNQTRHITYGKYPDPLRRLQGALQSHEGRFLIVTAKPGYELAEAGAPTHSGGGAHGGLDASASLVPLIIYGTEKRPDFLRIVDLKAYLLDLLKSESRK